MKQSKQHILSTKILTVTQSRNGLGVISKKHIPKETVLFEITGPKITCDEDDDIPEIIRSNTYRYDENFFINPEGTIANYVNHSCNPNTKVIKRGDKLYLQTIAAVLPGKEICFDYSTILGSDDSWKMKCNCGSKKCRSFVKKFTLLPKELRNKYNQKNIIPEYMLSI